MNKTENHPIELAIVAAVVVLEAVVVLVAAVVALVVTLARWEAEHRTHGGDRSKPCVTGVDRDDDSARGIRRRLQKRVAEPEPIKYPSSTHQVAQPQLHPLALIATQLQALPVATLRQMANTRSKTVRKAQLIEMVAACS